MSQLNTNRRDFLKTAGIVAGVGILTSLPTCRAPKRNAIPYAIPPEDAPNTDGDIYATAFPMPFWSESILVKTSVGRPIKIDAKEGGGTSIYAQSSIADLYSNLRMKACEVKGKEASFPIALEKLDRLSNIWRNTSGEGLAILKGADYFDFDLFKKILPKAKIVEYEKFNFYHSFEYCKAYFNGEPVKVLLNSGHKNILSFGCDFLGTEAIHCDIYKGFNLSDKRIFSVSEERTLTSERSTKSLISRKGRLEYLARAVYTALVSDGTIYDLSPDERFFVDSIIEKLSFGESVCLASPLHSKSLHETVLAINLFLSGEKNLPYVSLKKRNFYSLDKLSNDIENKTIKDLIVVGIPYSSFIINKIDLSKLENKICLVESDFEEKILSDFDLIIPKKHYLESWKISVSAEGRKLLSQPMIEPLYPSLSDDEFYSKILGMNLEEGNFSHESIRLGIISNDKFPQAKYNGKKINFTNIPVTSEIENIYPDKRFYDGRFLHNVWLQELPDVFNLKSWNDEVHSPWLNADREKLFNSDKSVALAETKKNSTYAQWAVVIDLKKCIGCGACAIACHAENNIAVVGEEESKKGRAMHWLKLLRTKVGEQYRIVPMMCMHCENAPCESLCPVNASIHNENGLSQITYNRCIGARYCAMNCPWRLRKFNFKDYSDEEPSISDLQKNPSVSIRPRGVIEKCSLCIQRVNKYNRDKKLGKDYKFETACSNACQFGAISIIDLNDMPFPENSIAVNPNVNAKPRLAYLLEDDKS